VGAMNLWSREILKTKAKAVLKDSYWKAFLVSLVIAIVGGNGGSTFNFNWNMGGNNTNNIFNSVTSPNSDWFAFGAILVAGLVALAVVGVILLALAFRILVGYPLEVGGRLYFTQSAQNNVNMNFLGDSFEKAKYFDIVKAMLWRGFRNFLWYLLFIIPGIIKSYSYSMVPYILADNPHIGSERALELSTQMTDGQKMDMFILDLSFIGWYILGALLFGIGIIFVFPYYNATKAELYLVFRENAIAQGLCRYEELFIS
jgi:uncharacterized membrane protein